MKKKALDRMDRSWGKEVSGPKEEQQDTDMDKVNKMAQGLYKKYKLDPSVVMQLAQDILKRGLKGLQKVKEKVFYVFFNDGGRAYIDGTRYSTSAVDYKNMIIKRAASSIEDEEQEDLMDFENELDSNTLYEDMVTSALRDTWKKYDVHKISMMAMEEAIVNARNSVSTDIKDDWSFLDQTWQEEDGTTKTHTENYLNLASDVLDNYIISQTEELAKHFTSYS